MHNRQTWNDFDWARAEANWNAWWAGQLDRPLIWITRKDRTTPLPTAPQFVPQLPDELSIDEIIARYEAHLDATIHYADAVPKWFVNYGAGITAAFLGAKVEADDHTVWFHPSEHKPIGEIHPTFDEANVWWQRVRDVTAAAVARWATRAAVSYTDLGGNLDILASLRTSEGLLMDTMDAPDELDRCVRDVTATWLDCYDRLDAIIAPGRAGRTPWAPIWSPRRTYMLQCDFAYMVSPAMFERFVVPDLVACCERMEDGFYHLDGKGQIAHLPHLCRMERLRGIQWIPGDGQPEAAHWTDVLSAIRQADKLCQVFASPEGALKIIDEHDGGRGFVLQVDSQDFRSTRAVSDFLNDVERRRG